MLSVLPDAVVATAATPVTIDVLANDIGTALTITSFAQPAHGSLVFNADKTFTYTPHEGFLGVDGFTYTVRDGQGAPASAEVSITVVASQTMTAIDDFAEVITGGSIIIPVLANDRAGGGTLRLDALGVPGHGAASVLSDQTIRYVPQAGFIGIDGFTYTAIDEAGATATATVTVRVLAENQPPIAMTDSFTVEVGQTTILAMLANDHDPEGGPLRVVGFTMPGHGALAFNPDQTFSYRPDEGFVGHDQFTYTIRDNRGASATARVMLEVIEISESPEAEDDHVTTEAGMPVTIDVLANDSLPEGQAVAIVAVTMPVKGSLAFNADRTITYTPAAGFVGTDDFTYTIGGQGGSARATVTIEVTPATMPATYPNGYGHRRRLVLPAPGTEQTTVEDVVVLFAEQADWLKPVAQGGKVASHEGFDLRFESTEGGKLDHEVEHYDPATGALLAWVRLPSVELASRQDVLLYYGNPAIEASEADPAGTWQGYLARWRPADGSDATGNGRDLAPENIAAGTLLDEAASLDGTGRLTLAATDWLDGLSALTVQALVGSTPAMIGGSARILGQGEPDAQGRGITLGYLAESATGLANVVYASVGATDGEALVVSLANRQAAGGRQLIHARWQSGTAPRLYLNGINAASSASQSRAGATRPVAGPLELGRDWIGELDEIRITGRALPAAWIEAEARNMLTPELSYGVGHEETVETIEAPVVAVPFKVRTQAGKWLDIDVLSQSFAPADGGPLGIVAIGQPANGTATVLGQAVRYTPTTGFAGVDQLAYTIGNGDTQSVGLIRIEVIDPAGQGEELPPGTNLLANSRLSGETAAAAEGWSVPFEPVQLASIEDGHRQARFVSADAARSQIEQQVTVEKGKRYVFSIDCMAVIDARDTARVVINHVPFSAATLVTPRPTVGDMVAGQRFHYVFDATVSGTILLRAGLELPQGGGGADIILARPMLDQAVSLRGYTGTAPFSQPQVDVMDWDFVPNNGWYEGAIHKVASAIMSQRIRSGYFGWRMTMRRGGALRHAQFHIASNRVGETSKSRVNGNDNHSWPASWKLGFRVFNANSNWQITGAALRDIHWTCTNPTGDADDSRVLYEFDLANLPVNQGQRLLFLVYSRESSPENSAPSVNMVINGGAPSLGLNPPRAVSLLMGDDPYFVRGTSTLTPIGRGELYNIGLRYADGAEAGDTGFDASTTAHRINIGGSNRVRQRWSSPYWRRARQIALAVYRRPNLTAQAGLSVRISGPDISAVNLTIPAANIQIFDEQIGSSYTHTHQAFDLPVDLLLSPNSVYTVEISSPGSSGDRYRTHTLRHFKSGLAHARVSSLYPSAGIKPIEPHKWSGTAEKSDNSGSSWSPATWAAGGADLAFALVTNRRMAATLADLPA